MDRAIKRISGFTFVELIIVIAIVGILSAIGFNRIEHMKTVNGINEDMHRISAFIHAERSRAFTRKQTLLFKVVGNELQENTSNAVLLTLNNTLRATGSPFTITSRGNITPTGGTSGNISLTTLNTGAEYSCILLDNIRTRLGVWNGAICNPI